MAGSCQKPTSSAWRRALSMTWIFRPGSPDRAGPRSTRPRPRMLPESPFVCQATSTDESSRVPRGRVEVSVRSFASFWRDTRAAPASGRPSQPPSADEVPRTDRDPREGSPTELARDIAPIELGRGAFGRLDAAPLLRERGRGECWLAQRFPREATAKGRKYASSDSAVERVSLSPTRKSQTISRARAISRRR